MFLACLPLVTMRSDIKELHRKCLRAAISRVYRYDGAACEDMGVKQAHYSAEMAGERALNLDHKSNLDVRVWSWYAVFLAAEFGVPEELDVMRQLDDSRRRMAKMDAPTVAQERTA